MRVPSVFFFSQQSCLLLLAHGRSVGQFGWIIRDSKTKGRSDGESRRREGRSKVIAPVRTKPRQGGSLCSDPVAALTEHRESKETMKSPRRLKWLDFQGMWLTKRAGIAPSQQAGIPRRTRRYWRLEIGPWLEFIQKRARSCGRQLKEAMRHS